jgi:hypothetical protein
MSADGATVASRRRGSPREHQRGSGVTPGKSGGGGAYSSGGEAGGELRDGGVHRRGGSSGGRRRWSGRGERLGEVWRLRGGPERSG